MCLNIQKMSTFWMFDYIILFYHKIVNFSRIFYEFFVNFNSGDEWGDREGVDWVGEVGGGKCDGFRRVVIGGATMTFSTSQKTVSHN